MAVQQIKSKKPLLRGHFHQAAFFTALGACAMLIKQSQGFDSVLSSAIFSLSLMGQFGISALYHRPNWSDQYRKLIRRLDHGAIFVLIAGSFTPLCLLTLRDTGGSTLLVVIWSAASIGLAQCLFWPTAPRWLAVIFYVVMGWLALPYIKQLNESLGSTLMTFLVGGGLAYTAGAMVYILKRPNPWPKTLGYHEVFHLLTILAAICHFIVIDGIVTK